MRLILMIEVFIDQYWSDNVLLSVSEQYYYIKIKQATETNSFQIKIKIEKKP